MRILRNIIILFSPYLIIVAVNEFVRSTVKENKHTIYGIKTINSNDHIQDKCTWAGHETTAYCINNHVKFLKPYINKTDRLYFGIINNLHATGNYQYANIFLLAVIFPLVIWFSIIKIIDYSLDLLKVKKEIIND